MKFKLTNKPNKTLKRWNKDMLELERCCDQIRKRLDEILIKAAEHQEDPELMIDVLNHMNACSLDVGATLYVLDH